MKEWLKEIVFLGGLIIACNVFSMNKDDACASVVVYGGCKNGWSELRHLMVDKSSTIEQVESFLKKVDLLEEKDLHSCSVRCMGLSPDDELRARLLSCNVKVVNFLHSVILLKKLTTYQHQQNMFLIYDKLGTSFW